MCNSHWVTDSATVDGATPGGTGRTVATRADWLGKLRLEGFLGVRNR